MLVASMNPCPCGYYNHPQKECTCESGQVNRYLNKVSGPLLDRIDLHITVRAIEFNDMTSDTLEEDSSVIRERVINARAIQADRYKGKSGIYTNAQMTTQQLRKYCRIEHTKSVELEDTMKKNNLSARAYDRILKVSRTIADLEGREQISYDHFAEAVRYRCLDKEGWGTKNVTKKN
jgi:magnesium chelatase family protein